MKKVVVLSLILFFSMGSSVFADNTNSCRVPKFLKVGMVIRGSESGRVRSGVIEAIDEDACWIKVKSVKIKKNTSNDKDPERASHTFINLNRTKVIATPWKQVTKKE